MGLDFELPAQGEFLGAGGAARANADPVVERSRENGKRVPFAGFNGNPAEKRRSGASAKARGADGGHCT